MKYEKFRQLLIGMMSLLVIMLLGGSTGIQVDAATEQPQVVKVGWYLTPDYMEITEEGKANGFYYDYLQTLSYYTGWQCEYVVGSWAECLGWLESGEIDLLCSVHKTPEREDTLLFSAVDILTESCKLYVADDASYQYGNYQSFNGMKIAVADNSFEKDMMAQYAKEMGFSYEEILCQNYNDAFNAVDEGRADGMVAETFDNHPGYSIVDQFASAPVYFATGKKSEALMNELNYGMNCLSLYYPTLVTDLYTKHVDEFTAKQISLTEEEVQYIENMDTITMVCGTKWYPFEYYDEEQNFTGISVEIMKKISQITGIPVNYVEDTGFSMSNFRENDTINCLTSMSWDGLWAEDSHVYQTQPFLDADVYMIKDTIVKDCKTVALLKSGYLYNKVIEFYPELQQVTCSSTMDCIEAVADGRADCTFLNEYEASYYLELSRFHRLSTQRISQFDQKICFAISAVSDPILVEILSKALTFVDHMNKDELVWRMIPIPQESIITKLYYDYPIPTFICMALLLAAIFFTFILLYRSSVEKKKRLIEENANRSKTEFLSLMSHDMRTPLNGILGISYLMNEQTSLEDVKAYIPKLQESGQYLLQLINDVLDARKIEAKKMVLNPVICNEKQIFDAVIEMIEPLYREKHQSFYFEKVQVEWKTVLVDAQRVKQIFINLLSNAIKYTPEGGRIDFIMEQVGEQENSISYKFVVKDNGMGMSKDFLPHMFESFSQENREKEVKGSGLGLPIVKQLVDMMGGSIEAKSELNQGTEITVLLDFMLTDGVGETPYVLQNEDLDEILKNRHVLLCEDHPLNAQIAQKLLANKGIQVTLAKNGKEALQIFMNSPVFLFDAILMDVRMPVMNGIEATRAIRTIIGRGDASRIPIIAMTANAYDKDVKDCLAAGMNVHLSKPIDPVKMYTTLAELLRDK